MNERREGIQVDKPIPPWERSDCCQGIQSEKPVPPWEQPGCFRMDCEPYRGNLLWWLACGSYVLGLLALFPCVGWCPGLLGIPFNLFNRYLAKADLGKMQAGLMDRAGEEHTSQARSLSTLGFWFSLAGTIVWGGMNLLFSWITGPSR